MTRRDVVETALASGRPDRVPCFPLVDVVYAGSRGCHSLAQIQLDPELHAEALSRCVQELPIDGIYVNLCLGKQQAARVERGDGWHRVRIDGCLVLGYHRRLQQYDDRN